MRRSARQNCRVWPAHAERAGASWPRGATARRFTLLELLIVLVIIALGLALVVPRVARLPTGLRVRSAASQFHTAFRDAANRARATGATVKLTLDVEENLFRLEEIEAPPVVAQPADSATAGAAPKPAVTPADAQTAEHSSGRYRGSKEYALPKGLEWRIESAGARLDEAPYFIFYANGEAAGPALELSAGKRRFRLDIDRLTGRPSLNPVTER